MIRSLFVIVFLLSCLIAGDAALASPASSPVPGREQASRFFFAGQYDRARAIMEKTGAASDDRARLNLALLDIIQGRKKSAFKALKVIDSRLKTSTSCPVLMRADVEAALAECEYDSGQIDHALAHYEFAWSIYGRAFGPLSADNIVCMEGLAGSLIRKRKFDEAAELLTSIAIIDRTLYGETSERFYLTLRMLTACYAAMGRSDIADALSGFSMASARYSDYQQVMAVPVKAMAEGKISQAELESADRRVRSLVLGGSDRDAARNKLAGFLPVLFNSPPVSGHVRPQDFDNWTLPIFGENRQMTPVSIDPFQPVRTFIICIHGFGLSGDSYADFGRRMAKRGHAVLAMDMLGFGDYSLKKGTDTINTGIWLKQVVSVVDELRRNNPGLRVVLMGESMGGAIALQSAALCQDRLGGLICSVPGGERYGQVRESLMVARRFLRSKWKPIDIGTDINKQMFLDPEKQKLEDLDNSRGMVAPEELRRFQKFMRQSVRIAPQIEAVPSIFFQGFSDRLVKPKGTAEIYKAVKCPAKDLIIVGNQEHLIFEEGECPEWIIDCLDGWLQNKVVAASPPDGDGVHDGAKSD